jgi:signal transduction histidine kinase
MKILSIQRSLILRISIGLGVLLCVISVWTYITVRRTLYREMDRSITQVAALLSNQIELDNGKINFEWKEGLGTNQILKDDALFQFWDESSGETTRSSGLQSKDLPMFSGDGTAPMIKDITLPKKRHHGRAIGIRVYPFLPPHAPREIPTQSEVVDPKTRPHILVVARDSEGIEHVLQRIGWILSVGTLLILGISYLLIVRVIRTSLHPIHNLADHVKNRSERQLDSALDLSEKIPQELAGLAESFDSLLARLSTVRQRERDFIRHAAHELRTPIAGLRATTDLALSQSRDADSYAKHLATCHTTAVELSELVERLTALSRIEQSQTAPTLSQIDLVAHFNECLTPILRDFQKEGLTIQTDFPTEPMIAMGHSTLVKIIFNNLLNNAAAYARSNSEVRVQGFLTEQEISLHFSNQSEFSVENPNRLFEPLFRAETSRSDAANHLGIGLTLSQEAAAAMNAKLTVQKNMDDWIVMILTMNRFIR